MNKVTGALTTSLIAVSLYNGAAQADLNDWYMQQLFEPSENQLAMEQRGRIMIYDGMRDRDVQRALHEQFDRVEAMMFTGTVVTDEKGEPARDEKTGKIIVENDGCD
jgi:hypothetical protein